MAVAVCRRPGIRGRARSVQASYDVYREGMKVGQIEETYIRDKDHYTLSSTTTPVGILAVFRPEKIFINSSGLVGRQGCGRCCSATGANATKTGTAVPSSTGTPNNWR